MHECFRCLVGAWHQWSHRPTDSFPAARALLTNGAASIVADAAAEVATNRRRVKAFLFICVPPIICQHGSQSGSETQAKQQRLAFLLGRRAETVSLHPNMRCQQINS